MRRGCGSLSALILLGLSRAASAQAPAADPCAGTSPGKVTLHRLNRAEFDNTVRDLLGDESRPARAFPVDDFGHGFDNNADVLSLSPLLLEKYAEAADRLVNRALLPDKSGPVSMRGEAESAKASLGELFQDWGWELYSNGDVSKDWRLPQEGTYVFRVRAAGFQAGPEPCKMSLTLDGKSQALIEVKALPEAPEIYQAKITAGEGRHSFSVEFTNDYYNPDFPDKNRRDRNLVLDWFEIQGPVDGAATPDQRLHDRLLACAKPEDPASCQAEVLARFGASAWRRPLAAEEMARISGLADKARAGGASFDEGLARAFKALLLSPNFLYRVETDPAGPAPRAHLLSDFELASRLSYFLWSSMPDDELRTLAQAGALAQPAVLQGQVDRMIKDGRSQALVDNFVGQWLYLRGLAEASPSKEAFPEFDEELRAAMKIETSVFFRSFLVEDKSLLDMFDADYVYVNERLAKHYGIPGVQGVEFRKVPLPQGRRGGLLEQAGLLTVTSNPTRTSPVKRGKWILEQLLCDPPPPPPPGIAGLTEEKKPSATLRQKMDAHRRFPICASCHQTMDSLGLALENYDGVGAWRDQDGAFAIDASGDLPDKRHFGGARELGLLIKADSRTPRCLAQRLLTYALGRGVDEGDACFLDRIASDWKARGYRLRDLISLIVFSEPFRARKGEPVLKAETEGEKGRRGDMANKENLRKGS